MPILNTYPRSCGLLRLTLASRQPEAKLQVEIVRALRGAGFFAIRTRLEGISGFPDIYALKNGVPFHIEVKVPGKRARRIQEYFLGELRKFGAEAFVATGAKEVLEKCEKVMSRRQRSPKRIAFIVGGPD